MSELTAALASNAGLIAAVSLVVALVSLLCVSVLWLRVRRLRGSGHLPSGEGHEGLESVIGAHGTRIRDLASQVASVGTRTGELEVRGRRAVQRIGLVRYNPFEDTGSNQSFALALLDDNGDGIVLSSLHSRHTTRIYAKPLVRGRSEAPLSTEETEALRRAREDTGTRG